MNMSLLKRELRRLLPYGVGGIALVLLLSVGAIPGLNFGASAMLAAFLIPGVLGVACVCVSCAYARACVRAVCACSASGMSRWTCWKARLYAEKSLFRHAFVSLIASICTMISSVWSS